MEIVLIVVSFIAGGVVSYFIHRILDRMFHSISSLRKQHHWKQTERVWKKYESLSDGLEVVQTGWRNGSFLETQVIITMENSFNLPTDIASEIRERHRPEWEAANLKNNEQFGISQIDPYRISDEFSGKSKVSHELRIHGHLYNYFDFLSTHRIFISGTPQEKMLLENKINKPHYLQPIPLFPNPLSVGLSLFCEEGNYLVLTRRTKLLSSGGLWFGHSIFNAVGENITPIDISGDYMGYTRLSPWITAKRGLKEEMGIELNENMKSSLLLHSFVWDNRIFDYKFFGYSVISLSRADVRRLWINAPDRHENSEIWFYETSTTNQCLQIIKNITEHKKEWSSEAILCTILSLLHLRKVTSVKFENFLITFYIKRC